MNIAQRALNKTRRVTRRHVKSLRQRITPFDDKPRRIAFVTGCQRSGTSMTYKIFDRDPSAAVYDEVSVLSDGDSIEGLRLNDLSDVRRHFDRNPARLIVAKPLVESQRLAALLDEFDGSKAIWMFRHYSDVVGSNLRRFGEGNGFRDLRPIIDGDTADWRAEGLDPDVASLVREHAARSSSPTDAAALFWYARNSLLFKNGLDGDARLLVCRYEELVTSPVETIASFYRFLDYPLPAVDLSRGIATTSIGKGSSTSFSTDVIRLCDEMMERLSAASGARRS